MHLLSIASAPDFEYSSDDAESGSDEEEKVDAQRQKATGKKVGQGLITLRTAAAVHQFCAKLRVTRLACISLQALTPKRRKTSKAEPEVGLDTPLLGVS